MLAKRGDHSLGVVERPHHPLQQGQRRGQQGSSTRFRSREPWICGLLVTFQIRCSSKVSYTSYFLLRLSALCTIPHMINMHTDEVPKICNLLQSNIQIMQTIWFNPTAGEIIIFPSPCRIADKGKLALQHRTNILEISLWLQTEKSRPNQHYKTTYTRSPKFRFIQRKSMIQKTSNKREH